MPPAYYWLLWYPATRTFEATRLAARPQLAGDAVVLHRRHSPNLVMPAAYAEVGVDLLPRHARPSASDGVGLLWVPLVPSQCLLATRTTRPLTSPSGCGTLFPSSEVRGASEVLGAPILAKRRRG